MTREKALLVQEEKRREFQKADDAWSAELQRVFGKQAGDMRYGPEGKGAWGSTLRSRYYIRETARRVWHDAVDNAREYGHGT